ncbi:helix-turn-helix transcriptional regulator [Salimicrobium salexigens]|uniref:helix-turn-helix transcriptional regulator n=1 Tax=Salimicrobium salexigens TaxID=908941 RepID=UPI0009703C47|nr:helix-turn-helix transcriptional regulator [Salimicrobium salexigens]
MDYPNSLLKAGQNIKLFRLEKGLSQEKLGHAAGISRSYMGAIERGETGAHIYVYYKLAKALDISIETITKGT